MAVPNKNSPKTEESAIKAAILDAVSELYDEHEEQIRNIRDRAEGKSITVTFANVVDCSESAPFVTTKIRFSETYTDERTNQITEDVKNQFTFETIQDQGRGGRKNEKNDDDPEEKDAA